MLSAIPNHQLSGCFLCTAVSVERVKDKQRQCRECPCHIRGQKTTLNTRDVYVFHHPVSVGEWRNRFFFLLCTEQNCRDKQTLPCKVKTQHLRCVLTYWFSLAAIGRRSKEDGAMCAGPRELGEIQAALCTPREWGLAYIECLCCRIESVEHLCLNSLTVKLGLTKNPSYTNTKWSRAFFSFFFFLLPKIVFTWAFLFFSIDGSLCFTWKHTDTCVYERDEERAGIWPIDEG